MEEIIQEPDFWREQKKAAEINQRLVRLKKETEKWDSFEKELEDIEEMGELSGGDEKLQAEVAKKRESFAAKINLEKTKTLFTGKYDSGNAALSLHAGAGGQDAQDWAAMLLRMYQRYADRKCFETRILEQTFGEGGGPDGRIGVKSVTLQIKGNYAFGFLKNEAGVHRLVRISPFSAKKLRHTSFVLVEVLPEISKTEEGIEIKPDDLKIETFRSSGPGGQYVNKRESAIRITHLPTKITVSCQVERLQGLNRERAMKLLYARLYQLKEKERKEEMIKIKGKPVSIEWGNQIRSYVLAPYKLVKDLKTGMETSGVDRVLDGDLDQFISKI